MAGYQMVLDYLKTSFELDSKGFEALLSENVEMKFIATDNQVIVVEGIEQVMNMFQNKFFQVTTDFNVQNVNIISNELTPVFTVKVFETKKQEIDGETLFTRVLIVHHSRLTLVSEDNKWKISHIATIATLG